jgi:hypothetical protein
MLMNEINIGKNVKNAICFTISLQKKLSYSSISILMVLQSDDFSELNGVWGEELFESDNKKKSDWRSERVFLSPMLLLLLAPKV